jgi:hypothetical protein
MAAKGTTKLPELQFKVLLLGDSGELATGFANWLRAVTPRMRRPHITPPPPPLRSPLPPHRALMIFPINLVMCESLSIG